MKALSPWGLGVQTDQTPTLTSSNSTSLQNINGNFLIFLNFYLYSNNSKHKQQLKATTKLPTCLKTQLPLFCWKENGNIFCVTQT